MSNTARNFCLIQTHSTNNIQLHFFVCLVFHNIYNVYTVTRKPKFPLLDCTRGGPSKQHKLVELLQYWYGFPPSKIHLHIQVYIIHIFLSQNLDRIQ